METTIEKLSNRGTIKGQIDGKPAGVISFSVASDELIIIDHTEVDDAFRGKSVGKQLLIELVDYLRENRIKAIPLCPFAKATFDKMPELRDVLK